jgi:hypothetical protein
VAVPTSQHRRRASSAALPALPPRFAPPHSLADRRGARAGVPLAVATTAATTTATITAAAAATTDSLGLEVVGLPAVVRARQGRAVEVLLVLLAMIPQPRRGEIARPAVSARSVGVWHARAVALLNFVTNRALRRGYPRQHEALIEGGTWGATTAHAPRE